MREIIVPGDPMLNISLPVALEENLKNTAKKNKRRPQDELIRRLSRSFKEGAFFSEIHIPYLEMTRSLSNMDFGVFQK